MKRLKFGKLPLLKNLIMYSVEQDWIYILHILDYDKLFIKCTLETYDNDLEANTTEHIRTDDTLDETKNVFLGLL